MKKNNVTESRFLSDNGIVSQKDDKSIPYTEFLEITDEFIEENSKLFPK